MIQVLAIREYYSQKNNRNEKHETWFDRGIRAASVEEIFRDPDAVLGQKVEESERFNLYYTVAECLEERGRKFVQQFHIPFDIDKMDLGDETDVNWETVERVARVTCKALGVKYDDTGVVFSGNGVQLLVGTTNPVTDKAQFDDLRRHYKACCEKINLQLMAAGLAGQADPSVWSPARLLRFPNTRNQKPNRPIRMAKVVQSKITRVDWSLERASGLPQVKAGDHLNAGVLAELITPDVKEIMNPERGCKFLHWAQTAPEQVSEPQWYAALSIVGRFPEGRKFAHKMSEGHPSYNFGEADTKITQALENSGPRTCSNIDSISDKCKGCVHFKTQLVSPIMIEGPDHIATEKNGFYHIGYDKDGNPKKGRPDYEGLWRFFCRQHAYVSLVGLPNIYVFNGVYWEEMKRDHILAFAQEHFEPRPHSSVREEFYKLVKVNNLKDPEWFSDSIGGLMNFKNGIYDMVTGALKPHNQAFGFRSVLPCDFMPKAEAPRFESFMDEVTLGRPELNHVMQEFFGYIFSNMRCEHEKILMLSGEGSNGKSTLVKLVRALAGEGGSSSISVKDMKSDQNRYLMEGKIVNVAEENSRDSFKDTELIKNFASGGKILVKKLFAQPYEYENRTKLIMLCNTLPANMDHTHGFYRRLLIVPFEAEFGGAVGKKADKGLIDKLLEELPGIFNWVVAGYSRLRLQGGFSNSTVISDAVSRYRVETDTVAAWFNAELELSENKDDSVAVQELYDHYVKYCQETGHKHPHVLSYFGRILKNLLTRARHPYEFSRKGNRVERKQHLCYVKLKEQLV